MTAQAIAADNALTALALTPGGNLDAYVRAVQQFPMLSQAREEELALRFRTLNDLESARELVLSHLRLVVAVSRQFKGYGLPQADLIQEGNIGLMKAVKRFDPTRGVRLVSFAMLWIKAEIHEYILRNWQLVKVATTKAQRKLFFNLRSLKQSLGVQEGVSEDQANTIAKYLNVPARDVMEMDQRMSGGDVAIEGRIEDGEETYAPIAYLAASDADPAQMVEASQSQALQSEGLLRALQSLDARSREIVTARWLREEDESNVTLHDLAAKFGISAERVRQIEAAALKKLRTQLS
ncbi:MAG: RNA polymerase sigma factor RpoH [Burkholderiaceae bacterium]|jgi:RNA polymerase sigma-32 factor|nr:RNA polymerase sigma factor RpoH [Betaproteobacteria bacterium]